MRNTAPRRAPLTLRKTIVSADAGMAARRATNNARIIRERVRKSRGAISDNSATGGVGLVARCVSCPLPVVGYWLSAPAATPPTLIPPFRKSGKIPKNAETAIVVQGAT